MECEVLLHLNYSISERQKVNLKEIDLELPVLTRNWTIVRVLSMMESVVFMILISTQNDSEQIQDDDRHSVDTIKYRTNSKYINYNKLHLFQPPYFDYSGFTTIQSLGANPCFI